MTETQFLKTVEQLARDTGIRKACQCARVPVARATRDARQHRKRKIKALKAHVGNGHRAKIDTLIRMRSNEITITALTKMIRTIPPGYINAFIALSVK